MASESRVQRTLFRASCQLLALPCAVLLCGSAVGLLAQDDKGETKDKKDTKRASLSLKATPPISFSPAKITVTAELRGGSDTTDELYCPSVEWDWGDGTKSEFNADCEPFEAGKSSIKRRFTMSHTYNMADNYRVLLRLRHGSKTIVGGNTSIQVKPGLRDPSENY
jgi:hypothetical protein